MATLRASGVYLTLTAVAFFLFCGYVLFETNYLAPASTPPGLPSPETLKALKTQWIDPVTDAPGRTVSKTYPQPSRGSEAEGSYLIQFPPSYHYDTERHYPVLIWLHAAMSHARQSAATFNYYWDLMHRFNTTERLDEIILVAPQALPVGWYVNSRNGRYPIEDVLVRDLVPHLDATYRTISTAEGRAVEGFAMGGYGALHLGLKYPDVFGAISALAPTMLPSLWDHPRELSQDFFGGSQVYYQANAPWTLAEEHTGAIRNASTAIRILSGDGNPRHSESVTNLTNAFDRLQISYTGGEVKGAGNDEMKILRGVPEHMLTKFWRHAFAVENVDRAHDSLAKT